MQLLGRLEIKSKEKIKEFLDKEHVGRIATIDQNGYPQIIPMNFVFLNDAIYMHSHTKGEKLENVTRNEKVGFEVDRELEFLPSYFEDPKDASLADTLYISVVIKGKGKIVNDKQEKTNALNGLMKKYQPEGRYEPISPEMQVLDEVAIIKVTPDMIRGKYKIGQNLQTGARRELAEKILERNSSSAKETLKIMGFTITEKGLEMTDEPVW
ncbi:MAG: pyridoxamine 5'-phosphate oxidase-like protein FMN-binding protein [Thaumarchaeota archaeon CSP1-1]|nr:MAG: pyridoxamine 5'-phosphate oxidase-like protein FMN-binding protein [Thaumarchaeota archaeon CSP1-1]